MWISEPPLRTVFRRRENDGEPVDDRRLRTRLASGEILRIGPGSFVTRDDWESLTPIARHAQRVWEAGARARSQLVFSHASAAALHGIDRIGAWPELIDVSTEISSGGRSSGTFRRRGRRLSLVDTEPWQRHILTTPLQTAIDVTAEARFLDGVVAADQALWARRPSGALVTASALQTRVGDMTGRGSARAARAIGFATGLADSVREPQSRVLIAVMGFPDPELQVRFVLSDGGRRSRTSSGANIAISASSTVPASIGIPLLCGVARQSRCSSPRRTARTICADRSTSSRGGV